MKRIDPGGAQSQEAEINLSPLIDCVFLLLIFFVVYAVFAQPTGMELERPSAVGVVELPDRAINLVVDAKGEIQADGRRLALEHVAGWVAERTGRGTVPATITADIATPAGILIALVDACRQGGASSVLVGADRAQPPTGAAIDGHR